MAINLENKKQIATIFSAIALGAVAVFLTANYVQTSIQSQTKQLAQEYQKRNAGVFDELELVKRGLKQSEAAQAALEKQIEQVRKQPAQVIVQQGGPATQPGEKGIDTTVFSGLTPPGKRAMTVDIESLDAVGGLVNPGDFVDVIGHMKIPKSADADEKAKPQEVTSVLFQNVQVLAVGTNFKPSGNSKVYEDQYKSKDLKVTLALDPEEASLLTFVKKNGNIQLMLRPPNELQTERMQVASWELLSDYVLDKQGTELKVPTGKADIHSVSEGGSSSSEVKPFIEIYRGGKELF